MSYTLYLIIFLGVPLAGLVYLLRGRLYRWALARIGAVVGAGAVYFVPWANYLVAARIWTHEPAMTLGIVVGYLPLEEYARFVLQGALVGLFALWLWYTFYPGDFG